MTIKHKLGYVHIKSFNCQFSSVIIIKKISNFSIVFNVSAFEYQCEEKKYNLKGRKPKTLYTVKNNNKYKNKEKQYKVK